MIDTDIDSVEDEISVPHDFNGKLVREERFKNVFAFSVTLGEN